MRLLFPFALHEARTQVRSLRFRVTACLYLAAACAPPALTFALRGRAGTLVGPATYAAATMAALPFLTAILAALLAVNGISRERDEGSLPVLGLSPVTNAGYLLRRWLSLLAIVVPITVLPLALAAALAIAEGRAPFRLAPFVLPFILHVLPLTAAASALGLGLGTITGGTISAAITGFFVFGMLSGPLEALPSRWGFRLDGPAEWLGFEPLQYQAAAFQWAWNGWGQTATATEAPIDAGALAGALLARASTTLGFSLLCLGLAGAFLRRSQRDLRPWRVREGHPLRTLLALVNRMRERFSPDPRLAPSDRLLLFGGAAAYALGYAFSLTQGIRFQDAARERFRVEVSGAPEPTPTGFVPVAYRIHGAIGDAISTEVSARFRNGGGAPVAHAAFELNPFLSVSVERDGKPQPVRRAEDRLSVTLDPPAAPGSEVRLLFRVRGEPGRVIYPFERPGTSFAQRFEQLSHVLFAQERSDVSRSRVERALTPRRVALSGAELVPVPRYTRWTLTPPPLRMGEPGRAVPREEIQPACDIAIDLDVPRGLFLADACGDLARMKGAAARLSGGCRMAVADVAVLGGELTLLHDTPGLRAFAVLPTHVAQARRHLPAFTQAARLASEAWPGIDPIGEAVFLEQPPRFSLDPFEGMGRWWEPFEMDELSLHGRAVAIPERALVQLAPMEPETLAARSVGAALAARRPLAPAESRLLRRLLSQVALERLGKGPKTGAVVEKFGDATDPLLKPSGWAEKVYRTRLAAVVHEMLVRSGDGGFVSGIETFLRKSGPGTARELLDDVGRAAKTDFSGLYRDTFAGDALPVLTLDGVRFHRAAGAAGAAGGWDVEGIARNDGTGEARCPVVLKTDFEPLKIVVTAGSHAGAPFRFHSAARPRAVLLDPAQECYRFRRVGVVELVEYREEP